MTGPRMTLPAQRVTYTGDHCILPSDNEFIANSLGADDLTRAEVDRDPCGFPAETDRDAPVAAVVEWLGR